MSGGEDLPEGGLRRAVPHGVSDLSVTAEPAPGRAASPTAGPDPVAAPPPSPRHARMVRRWTGLAAGAVAAAMAALARWTGRPAGHLIVPGVLIVLSVAAAAAAGVYLIPETAPARRSPATQPSAAPRLTEEKYIFPPLEPVEPGIGPTAAVPPGREAAKFAVWAAPLAARLQVPQAALEAYGYAQWVLEQMQPSCGVTWTTLAAIGKIESNHGRTGGSSMSSDGLVFPSIIGPPLNGQGNTETIPDTDQGELDNDATYDRAIGPMQFIPGTWRSWATDGDSNGIKDPQDIDDAALAAANYLCAAGRKLTDAKDWWAAILSYNHVDAYAAKVFDAANRYGQQSRNAP